MTDSDVWFVAFVGAVVLFGAYPAIGIIVVMGIGSAIVIGVLAWALRPYWKAVGICLGVLVLLVVFSAIQMRATGH